MTNESHKCRCKGLNWYGKHEQGSLNIFIHSIKTFWRTSPKTGDENTVKYMDLWTIPLSREQITHMYDSTYYGTLMFMKKIQMKFLHKTFYHPSSRKLLYTLKISRPRDATIETIQILQEISRLWDPCQ